MSSDESPAAVIAGASFGLGSALASALVQRGYHVVAMGRERAIASIANEVSGVRAIACELTNASDVANAMNDVEAREGAPLVVAYLAHRLLLAPFCDTTLESFEDVWRSSCFGAAVLAQRVLPKMKERGRGTLLLTGATGSIRGGAKTAAFASAKFALRGLAQSLARAYAPDGVHVAHLLLDGLIWSPQTAARFSPKREDCMDPSEVAEVLVRITEQSRSAWTHELDLRPYNEKF